MQKAHDTGEAVAYVCHAGNMEFITPVFYENTPIAYLQMGQFRDEEGECASRERAQTALRLYGDDGSILRLYDELPIVSKQKREALVRTLGMIIKSFWVDGLVYANRSMLSIKIERFIAERLQDKISVETLCENFYLSKNALYRLFHTEFSTTVGEYIFQKRMERAKSLLKADLALDIAEVASLCGFDDYNYFIRAFRKANGVTPKKFRGE
jgi:AraC-like DNA-binding protein